MDLVAVLQVSFAQLIGPSAIFYALLAIGLNLHFGYAGLLNFGQIGFALLGGYGGRDHDGHLRPAAVARHPRRSRRGRIAGARTRHPDAASARRLPRHRDDRGLRDPPAGVPLHCLGSDHRLHQRPLRIRRTVHRAEPLRLGPPVLDSRDALLRRRPVGDARRLDAGAGALRFRVPAQPQPPLGGECSRRSGRTRTPPARSARTSSSTRCRHWCSVVSSAASAVSSTPCRPSRSTPTSTRRRRRSSRSAR